MEPIRTTKRALRRLLLETQLLLDPPSDDAERAITEEEKKRRVMDVIRRLECVQIDPVSAVRPNQHLVLGARVADYDPKALISLLRGREIFEYWANAACLIPMEDYPIFEPARARLREMTADRLTGIQAVADQVLAKLEREGPLPAKAFDSAERVHGYWDDANAGAKTKATSHALELLTNSAELRIVGREGNQRLFDLVSRSVPAELLHRSGEIDHRDALGDMLHKYCRAYRVFDASDPRFGWQWLSAQERRNAIAERVAEGQFVALAVDGVKQPYYMLASDVERLRLHQEQELALRPTVRSANGMTTNGSSTNGIASSDDAETAIRFLPPLDNLLWSRRRLQDLFDFEYRWEIYTPAAKRTYGYYAMPILAGDRLIGRMDPRLDAKNRHLTVQLLQIDGDIAYTASLQANVRAALQDFARTNGADTVSIANESIGA